MESLKQHRGGWENQRRKRNHWGEMDHKPLRRKTVFSPGLEFRIHSGRGLFFLSLVKGIPKWEGPELN